MKITRSCILILLALSMRQACAGELVIIVNSAASAAGINKEQVADLYLGRTSGWTPIDQAPSSPIYVEFYQKATGRDIAQVKAIWSRIIFTGRGQPPKQMVNSAAVKKAVAADPKAIGYIEKSAVDASIKVALTLD
jgi:ABC-type phosphate transport system substrate-binding protein